MKYKDFEIGFEEAIIFIMVAAIGIISASAVFAIISRDNKPQVHIVKYERIDCKK